jgi:hypothetical protein
MAVQAITAATAPAGDRTIAGLRSHLLRQLNHWKGAAERLDDFEATASPEAWASLERYVGVALREGLKTAREQINREGEAVRAAFHAARFRTDFERVAEQIAILRKRYLQTELLVDFYVAAVRARSNPEVGLQLRACDVMAERVIRGALDVLAIKTPPVMTYFTTGVGASIMRIGTRLWDGSLSPIAAIRLTYHNRFRTTSLFHECGHQVAGITGWNQEFAQLLRTRLAPAGSDIADIAAGWASEIAADAFAFAWTGYAAVVALSDVVADQGAAVFRFLMGDPHPISYLRVMIGVEMCRRFFGMGPWDDLASAWKDIYPLSQAPPVAASVIVPLLPLLPHIVDASLLAHMQCFKGRSLAELVDPQRAAPAALREMQRKAAGAIFSSTHWIWTECVRLTALTGLRYATEPEKGPEILKQQEQWMIRLGEVTNATA